MNSNTNQSSGMRVEEEDEEEEEEDDEAGRMISAPANLDSVRLRMRYQMRRICRQSSLVKDSAFT